MISYSFYFLIFLVNEPEYSKCNSFIIIFLVSGCWVLEFKGLFGYGF